MDEQFKKEATSSSETLSAQANSRAMVSRRKFVGTSAALGAGLSALFLGACTNKPADSGKPAAGDKQAGGQAAAKDSLKIYVGEEPEEGFDPIVAYHAVSSLTTGYLFGYDEKGNVIGDMAESYDVNDAGTEYVLHIKKGIMFSDGTPMTAKDVAYTLNVIKDSKETQIDLVNMTSAVAKDETTVAVTLAKPFTPFIYELGRCGVVPDGKYDAGKFQSAPIATGPFVIKQWDKGQQLILVPNEHYYKEKSPFKQITLLFIEQENAIAQAIAGELDLIYVQPQLTAQANQVKGYSLQGFETIDVRGFHLPLVPHSVEKNDKGEDVEVGNDVLSDPAVRKALQIGLDRKWIIDHAWNGHGKPCSNYSVGQPWTNPKGDIKDARVDEANKLLDEAGWVKGADGVREKNGVRCAFTMTGRTDDIDRFYLAQALAENAKTLGMEITAEAKSWADCKAIKATTPTCWGFGDYSPYVQYQMMHSGAVYNFAKYSSEHTDKLLDDAMAENDHAKMAKLIQKAVWDDEAKVGPGSEDGTSSYLWIANFEHSFFVRDGLDLGPQTRHPHGHGWPIVKTMSNWKFKA